MKSQAIILTGANSYEIGEFNDPQNLGTELELVASPIAPLDLQIIAGDFPLIGGYPLITGVSGVGKNAQGKNFFIFSQGVGGGFQTPGVHRQFFRYPDSIIFPLHQSVDPVAASTVMISHLTAYSIIHDLLCAKAGDSILILGANGSLGKSCIAIGQKLGLEVFAASRAGADINGATGIANDAIGTEFLVKHGKECDFVINPLGGPLSAAAQSVSAPHSTHVLVGVSAHPALELIGPLMIGKAQKFVGFNLMTVPLSRIGELVEMTCDDLLNDVIPNLGIEIEAIPRYSIADGRLAIKDAQQNNSRVIVTST